MRTFGPPEALRAAERACAAVGLDPTGLRLVRLGSNAIFLLRDAPYAVRVARGPERRERVEREVAVARWLEAAGFPAVRLAPVAEQPRQVDGRPVTFWCRLDRGDEQGSTAELGALLRRLHALPPPDGLPLGPGRTLPQALGRLGALDPPDRDLLTGRFTDAFAAYDELTFALPPGPIHGDATVENVAHDTGGAPVLIDLEAFAWSPREWDLVLTAIYCRDLGWLPEDAYADFVAAYGFDVLDWPGYPVLRELRTLFMVAWMGEKAAEGPAQAAEFRTRMTSIRDGGTRLTWRMF